MEKIKKTLLKANLTSKIWSILFYFDLTWTLPWIKCESECCQQALHPKWPLKHKQHGLCLQLFWVIDDTKTDNVEFEPDLDPACDLFKKSWSSLKIPLSSGVFIAEYFSGAQVKLTKQQLPVFASTVRTRYAESYPSVRNSVGGITARRSASFTGH